MLKKYLMNIAVIVAAVLAISYVISVISTKSRPVINICDYEGHIVIKKYCSEFIGVYNIDVKNRYGDISTKLKVHQFDYDSLYTSCKINCF